MRPEYTFELSANEQADDQSKKKSLIVLASRKMNFENFKKNQHNHIIKWIVWK